MDGEGEPVEWLLEMRRFDQDALLDRLAQRHALGPGTIDALAAGIAAFHAEAERRPDRGGYRAMAEVIEGNAAISSSLAGPVLDEERVRAVDDATREALGRARDLLERRRAGFVRRCHGDLHLGNIVLLDGAPVLFDCLEFDEDLATIDTFYDLAFLLMDLLHRDLGGLAQRLLGGYLDATWDDAGTALLPLFLSCRAAIRAKVEGFARKVARRATRGTRSPRHGPISSSRSVFWPPRRPVWSRSAAFPAPASRPWRARWRRGSAPRPAPSRCAAT